MQGFHAGTIVALTSDVSLRGKGWLTTVSEKSLFPMRFLSRMLWKALRAAAAMWKGCSKKINILYNYNCHELTI